VRQVTFRVESFKLPLRKIPKRSERWIEGGSQLSILPKEKFQSSGNHKGRGMTVVVRSSPEKPKLVGVCSVH
jgi:hypothetical protein